MLIVFGHNNFNLLSVEPAEIGMFGNETSGVRFQLRQKYAHLFYIPIFPLGKMWAINRGDGKLYHCPAEIEILLSERYPKRTSVFAWSGILLTLAILLIVYISGKMSDYRYEKIQATRYAENAATLKESISQLKPGQVLMFVARKNGEGYYDYNNIPMKVIAVDGNNIALGSYSEDFSTAVTANDDAEIVKTDMLNTIKDTITISKETLRNAVSTKFSENNTFAGIELKDFYHGGVFKLNAIKDIPGPMLSENYEAQGKSDHYFEIGNKGYSVIADSIVAVTPGTSWQLSKKRFLSNDETVAVKHDGHGKAILYCSGMENQKYKFEIDNSDYSLHINKME
jgi:hypothetical protein